MVRATQAARKIVAVMVVVAAWSVVAVDLAFADTTSELVCTTLEDHSLDCHREERQVGTQPVDDDEDTPGSAGSGNAAPAECREKAHDNVVDCTRDGGFWSNAEQCYMKDVSDQYPYSDYYWKGHTDGYLYSCTPLTMRAGDRIDVPTFGLIDWYENRQTGPASPPDPEAWAYEEIVNLHLEPVRIGTAPKAEEGYVGLIGLPQWMWVVEPSETTWGPISRSDTDGPYTISLTAHVDHVVWDMGDGETVTCTTVGDEYLEEYGDVESPSCGYRYHEDGYYTVTATSYWAIEWEGVGDSGVIDMQLSDSVDIAMGEIQVLTK